MKFTIAALALANVAGVLGHGYVSSAIIDGKTYPGWNPYGDVYISPPPQRIFRPMPGNGPVCDITLIDIQCNGWTEGGVKGSSPAALSAPVTAGSTVSLQWTLWPDSHKGSTATYMAKCPGDCSSYLAGTDAVWFKVAEQGKTSLNTNVDAEGWATDPLTKSIPYTFTVPKSLANGNYIVRHEVTALHGASAYTAGAGGCAQGIQFYPSCFQVTVQGGGSATGPATKVSIPGVFTPSSPGIVYDITKMGGKPYPVPGPAVWTGGDSGGGSSPTTTTTSPPRTTTTTVAPPRTTTTATTRPIQTTTTTTRQQTTITTTTRPLTTTTANGGGSSCAAKYGQCGGQNFTGPTCCEAGSTCKFSNAYYSQCL
ncbi:Esterase/lipase/thioesterase [Rhizophlyctis rosea]|nr:Esterase/lipase/thioesterase [Rhizophlyctis rosea]